MTHANVEKAKGKVAIGGEVEKGVTVNHANFKGDYGHRILLNN